MNFISANTLLIYLGMSLRMLEVAASNIEVSMREVAPECRHIDKKTSETAAEVAGSRSQTRPLDAAWP